MPAATQSTRLAEAPVVAEVRPGQTTRTSIWALMDQGIASLGSFGLQILLARSATQVVYGTYALVWVGMLFVNNLHAAIITYPISVKGHSTGPEDRPVGVVHGVVLTLALFGPGAALLLLAANLLGMTVPVWPVLCALMAWQIQEVFRRSLMARLSFKACIPGDLISYPGQVVLLWVVSLRMPLTLPTVFYCMAATSTIAAMVQLAQLRPALDVRGTGEALASCWRLGRWSFANNWISVFSVQAFIWAVAIRGGAGAAAAFQSLNNVMGVTHPVIIGIANAIVPTVARSNASEGIKSAVRRGLTFGLHGAALIVPYLIVLAVVPVLALELFYGRTSPYIALSGPIRWMCAAYLLMYTGQVAEACMNGLRQPKYAFLGQASALIPAALVGLPLAAIYGVKGAAIGLLITNVTKTTAQITLLRNRMVAGLKHGHAS